MRTLPSFAHRHLYRLIKRTVPYLPSPLQTRIVERILVRRFVMWKGQVPRLYPPATFNEHVLRRIIHDRDPRLKIVCDKLAVRRHIAEKVGEQFVVPLLGAWRSASDIEWDRLPPAFVLKPSHSSGQVALIKSPSDLNVSHLKRLAASWIAQDYFSASFEWGYLGVPRHILAEPLLTGPDGGPPVELQIQVVRGTTIQIGVITGERGTSARYGDWFYANGLRHPGRTREPIQSDPLPGFIRQEAVPVAERVAADFDQMRVDFYVTADGLKIGELTPYHSGAHANFDPPELDLEMGRLWSDLEAQEKGPRKG